MPTSVHIPPTMLEQIDREARALKVSRNRFIVNALERHLTRQTEWSPGFFEKLGEISPDDASAVDEMVAAILRRRTSKKPPRL